MPEPSDDDSVKKKQTFTSEMSHTIYTSTADPHTTSSKVLKGIW